MMILDKVENLGNYPQLKAVQDFLKAQTGVLENGKYEVDENCYVAVSSYDSKQSDGRFEGHLRYVDVQIVMDGEEYVLVQDKNKCVLQTPYDSQKDAAFYSAENWHTFYLGKGDFIVLDENDLHRPCISVNGATPVKKYVFKIKKA